MIGMHYVYKTATLVYIYTVLGCLYAEDQWQEREGKFLEPLGVSHVSTIVDKFRLMRVLIYR